MKSFNNKRSVNATVCNLVTDFNEVQYHLLEVMYVHLYHTRGPPVSSFVTRSDTVWLMFAMCKEPEWQRACSNARRPEAELQPRQRPTIGGYGCLFYEVCFLLSLLPSYMLTADRLQARMLETTMVEQTIAVSSRMLERSCSTSKRSELTICLKKVSTSMRCRERSAYLWIM